MNKDKIMKILFWLFFILLIFGPSFGKSGFIIFIILAILAVFIFQTLGFWKSLRNKKINRIIDINNNSKFMGNIQRNITIAVLIFFGLWLFFASIVVVGAGETGVYSLFGKVNNQELHSGFHLVIPLAKVTKMSIRTEEYTMSITHGEGRHTGADAIAALTKEGLSVNLDITVLYHLDENKSPNVYKNVGLNYEEKIIRPAIRTSIRNVIARYEAKDIYSEKRQEASDKIFKELSKNLSDRGIVLEKVLLRNVKLPTQLSQAIQDKMEAQQEAEKYDFILEKEKKEKQRKIIEAEGQRDAQKIINQSLSQNYLYYLYIKDLKDRQGTIYVPTNPNNGMPLFKDLRK